jgi:hypothetical protein
MKVALYLLIPGGCFKPSGSLVLLYQSALSLSMWVAILVEVDNEK